MAPPRKWPLYCIFINAEGEPCLDVWGNPRRSRAHGFCPKHYVRFKRHGLEGMTDEATRTRKLRGLANKPQGTGITPEQNWTCMCGHARAHHKWNARKCRECKCPKASEAPAVVDPPMDRDIAALGYEDHVGENARCTYCFGIVQIGSRTDIWAAKRALSHRRRECPKTKPVGVQGRLRTSPNRAERVD